jgi:hypothetical protein
MATTGSTDIGARLTDLKYKLNTTINNEYGTFNALKISNDIKKNAARLIDISKELEDLKIKLKTIDEATNIEKTKSGDFTKTWNKKGGWFNIFPITDANLMFLLFIMVFLFVWGIMTVAYGWSSIVGIVYGLLFGVIFHIIIRIFAS